MAGAEIMGKAGAKIKQFGSETRMFWVTAGGGVREERCAGGKVI